MQNHYQINVAYKGIYFFSTAQNQLTSEKDARKVFNSLSKNYPKEEGYSVTCYYWQAYGKDMKWEAE